ncbi:MAG: hypothetical protein ACKVS9_11880 [Phycisphaerae bacterium]
MNPRLVQSLGIVAFVGCLLAAFQFTPRINASRKELTSIGSADIQASAPPEYAFAIQALGSFRGLLTNIAFIRLEQYKMQGKFYDAMQLSSWISKLQPRFVSVWEFLAWNMAWNISVTTYTAEERWNWVYNGAKLIRDEGLKYNPRSVNLHRQLAWIFVNKMSESVDEYHMTYKRFWAWRMHLLLGPPPDPLGDYRPTKPFERLEAGIGSEVDALSLASENERKKRDAKKAAQQSLADGEQKTVQVDINTIDLRPTDVATVTDDEPLPSDVVRKAFYESMMQIARAPDSLAALYVAHPETREMVRKLRDLEISVGDETLTEDAYWSQEGLALTFFYPYRVLTEPAGLLERVLAKQQEDPKRALIKPIDEILGVRAGNPAGSALVYFLQKKVLREVYKLQPDRMANLISVFGPMDWRSVDAHSLYWVNEGLIAGNETISSFKNDKTNTARLIFFSLRNLYLRNRIIFEPYTTDVNNAYYDFQPDLNFIEPMHQAYMTYGKDIDPDPTNTGVGETFRSGHVNFLTESIRMLYLAGREREAAHYYEYMRENYGLTSEGTANEAMMVPLKDYVLASFREGLDSGRDVRVGIFGLMSSAFDQLADGNLAQYNALVRTATELHTNYNSDPTKGGLIKNRLPSVSDMQADVVREMFRVPPRTPAVTARKARMWQYLPSYLRYAVYDDLYELLSAECKAVEFDMNSAFPEPEGIEEHRKLEGRTGPGKKKDGVDVDTLPQKN